MKKILKCTLALTFLFLSSTASLVHASAAESKKELEEIYHYYRSTPSDINQHLTVLKQLAAESASVVEIGVRNFGSTWAILMGLAESQLPNRSFLEIEFHSPYREKLCLSKKLAHENGIAFEFLQGNDKDIDLKNRIDLLFIDTIHTYCHLTYELEKFSSLVNKYIVMHDTSPPWGYANDTTYHGDYSEYPESIDRTKQGLFPAISDFLAKTPEWILADRRFNNHGLVVLKRINNS